MASHRRSGPPGSMHDNSSPVATRDLFAVALFLGLAAAAGELCVLAYRHFVLHKVLRLGLDVAWMAPLNDAVVFCLIAVAMLVVVRSMQGVLLHRLVLLGPASVVGLAVIFLVPGLSLRSREVLAVIVVLAVVPLLEWAIRAAGARRTSMFVLVFAAVYAIVLAWPGLRWWASLMLAIGAARLSAAEPHGLSRLSRIARTGIPALGVLLAIVAGGTGMWRHTAERERLANVASGPGGRNVLLIIWDTVRSQSLSLYGNPRNTTPVLDRLASKGVTFDWAFSTAPWTLPSHASMFTGRSPGELSADDVEPLDDEYPTVAERLAAAGFVTAGFVANGFYCSTEHGLARGFVHYDDFPVTPTEVLLSTSFGRALSANHPLRKVLGYYDFAGRRSADDITGAFLHWLDRRPSKPFFVFLNYLDAHEPYLAPEPWRSMYGRQDPSVLQAMDYSKLRSAEIPQRYKLSAAQKRADFNAYEGGISYLDNRLGALLDSLGRRGVLRNTIVIITSDHGEHQGEHPRLYGHYTSLYTQETRVPLVIVTPDSSQARRVTTPVSLRDLAATVVDLAQLPPDRAFPGRSLARFWPPGAPDTTGMQDSVFSEFTTRGLTSVVSGGYHLIRKPSQASMLFHLASDPLEQHDLASTPAGIRLVDSIGTVYREALRFKTKFGRVLPQRDR